MYYQSCIIISLQITLHIYVNPVLSQLAVLAGWVIAMTLFLLTQYLPHLKVCDVPEECAWTRDGEVAWNSLMSTMYSLAISWIIFACINGYGGK